MRNIILLLILVGAVHLEDGNITKKEVRNKDGIIMKRRGRNKGSHKIKKSRHKEGHFNESAEYGLELILRQEIIAKDLADWNFKMKINVNLTKNIQKLVNVQVASMVTSLVIIAFSDVQAHNWLNPMKPDFFTNSFRMSVPFIQSLQTSLLDGDPYSVHAKFLRNGRRERSKAFLPFFVRYFIPWIRNSSWAAEEDYFYNDWEPAAQQIGLK